jgi:molybdenum-dependent DNA-binding transcriptional regulator ModE
MAAVSRRAGKLPPQSRLKLSHLRLNGALEDAEMVSAAAQSVNMSQPAASRMIAEMEALLDAPLCERLSRGVRLTPLGQSLARHARSVSHPNGKTVLVSREVRSKVEVHCVLCC